MDNNFYWSKTLLTAYRYFRRISGAIDKVVIKSALASHNICGQNYHQNNVWSISQKLIDLSQRKVTLINLKILVEQTLAEIDLNDAEILIEKFFDGLKTREIMLSHNISMRTAFRKIDKAITSFSNCLRIKGYTSSKIASLVKDEGWILDIYQKHINKNEEIEFKDLFFKAVNC